MKHNKYRSIVIFALIIFSIMLAYKWHIKKINQHEIKSLGSAYLFYDAKVCPNRTKLEEIKVKYSRQFDDNDANQKQFIDDNFNSLFMEGCSESEHKAN